MKYLVYYISIALFLSGCVSLNKRIEITHDYIINENWNESANAIKINKMRLKKDSTIDLNNLNQADVLNRWEEDASFVYFASVKIKKGDSYKNRKIYFNEDNGFTWLADNTGIRSKILGNLEKNNWYKFSNLVTYPYSCLKKETNQRV